MDQNRDLESFLRISIPPDSKIALDTTFRKPFTSSQMDHLISMIVRRVQQEPLQYIFGKWDFYEFTLLVRKPCLCPRPETEELVYLVSLDIQNMIQSFPNKYKERKIRILDVGAGTGAIGIALARMFPSHVQVVAIDIKETAIQLSRDNAQRLLQTSASHTAHPLYQAILCSAAHYTNNLFESQSSPYHFGFDIVVSNPPYIPLSDMSSLSDSVVKFEDTDALCGGVDGMDVIRIIISRLDEWWKRNSMEAEVAGYEPICWMEVDPSQPPLIRSIVDEVTSPIRFVETRRDLSGNNRFVKLSRR
jgi:release factor glutamine methyltransferase